MANINLLFLVAIPLLIVPIHYWSGINALGVALLSIKNFFKVPLLTPPHKGRISSIEYLYSTVFMVVFITIIYTVYIQSIGSGLDTYSRIFQSTTLLQSVSVFVSKNKNKQFFKWENISIPINKGILLNKHILNNNINNFWSKNVENLGEDLHLLILTRIKFDNGEFSTIGNLQRLNKEDKDFYINYLSNILDLKSDHYTSTPIIGFTISFGLREGRLPDKQLNNDKNKTISSR